MVDRYWREIESVENDIENAMQISSILLKLKGYDKKLEGLSKINTNEGNISSNLGKINNNSSTISTNFKQLTTNAGNISSNKGLIETNTSNISSNKGLIETNTSNISSNKGLIETNTSNISSNKGLIETNTKSISTNLEKIDNFTQYILQSGKDFEEKYTIEKQIFNFNKNKHFYTLFEKEIEFEFTKNSLLFVKNNMYYKYENLSNDYHRLQHEYNIYDGDNLIHKYLFNKDTYYDESLNPILHTNEDFCICFKKNYNKIKINLQLHRHNRHGTGNINLEIDDDNESYINIDYVDRNEQVDTNAKDISTNLSKINTNVTDISSNLGKIDSNINAIKLINKNSQDNSKNISNNKGLISTNTSSISSNLIKINSNEDDILFNLNEINYLKNNNSKSYLKNVYNILFYNNNEQISFKDKIFYEKVLDVDAAINDFIEIKFKIGLEYTRIDYRNYIKNIYEILDENDNSLYIKSINNDEYNFFSNKVTIDEEIFYTFTKNLKKIKFIIKFQKLSESRVIYLYYMKNDNYRLTIKNYGV